MTSINGWLFHSVPGTGPLHRLVLGSAALAVASVGGVLLVAGLVTGCASDSDRRPQDGPPRPPQATSPPGDGDVTFRAHLVVGEEQPVWLAERLTELFERSGTAVQRLTDAKLGAVNRGDLVLSVGRTSVQRQWLDIAELAGRPPDSYALRIRIDDRGVIFIVALGVPDPNHYGFDFDRGSLYGIYAALERLGFAFLHPLAPHVPTSLELPVADLDIVESPFWRVRGPHLHAMHPLELTRLLNGWGVHGPDDEEGFEAMVPEWVLTCEWLLASRQNLVEWNILEASSWEEFATSPQRQRRLSRLVEIAHAHGLAVGADAGLVQAQQHNFRLIPEQGELDDELAQLRVRTDFLLDAGFDFISTELGTSEFTAPDDRRTLAWLDALAAHAGMRDKRVHTKIHVSSGQLAEHFTEPETGEPLNYNHLPRLAVPEVGVLPHTVQLYGLDDPAPTYGKEGFADVLAFMQREAGRREVLWHPETAYWVSYDVDVPLLLVAYAERRLRDLRMLARMENAGALGTGSHAGSRLDGQVYFSSGWEWGYWLNDLVTARAAFDPHLDIDDDHAAFVASLEPLTRLFGTTGPVLAESLAAMATDQVRLLIHGEVDGRRPPSVNARNGQAYLQGWETFDDLGMLAASLPSLPKIQTQPDKLSFIEATSPVPIGPDYATEVRPLLVAMKNRFAEHRDTLCGLDVVSPPAARPWQEELCDGATINALRARQVFGLYEYVTDRGPWGPVSTRGLIDLRDAAAALDEAMTVVRRRERGYRLPLHRMGAWLVGPTAYRFGYLWSVSSLYYWWRDEGLARRGTLNPCYLNIMDGANVAVGEGMLDSAAQVTADVLALYGLDSVGDCLAAPTFEPPMPPTGVRESTP